MDSSIRARILEMNEDVTTNNNEEFVVKKRERLTKEGAKNMKREDKEEVIELRESNGKDTVSIRGILKCTISYQYEAR